MMNAFPQFVLNNFGNPLAQFGCCNQQQGQNAIVMIFDNNQPAPCQAPFGQPGGCQGNGGIFNSMMNFFENLLGMMFTFMMTLPFINQNNKTHGPGCPHKGKCPNGPEKSKFTSKE